MPEAPTPLQAVMLAILETGGALTADAMLERVRSEHPGLFAGIPEPVVRGAVATGLRRLARRGRLVARGERFEVAPLRAPRDAWAVLAAA